MSKRHKVKPYWHNSLNINHNFPKYKGNNIIPDVHLSKEIEITDKTIAFIGPRLDCTIEKCVKEYTSLFESEGYQILFTPQAKMSDVIRFVPNTVVLFRVGTNEDFNNEIGLANVVKFILHVQSLGVRVVYYIDDLLIHKNNRAPISIASQCNAIIVATNELYDLFKNISNLKAPVYVVPTHIYLDLFDTLPPLAHIKSIPRYKVLMTSSGRLGALYLHNICEIANERWEQFDNIEWIVNAAGVAEMRTLINGFRNLHKTYIDWLSLNDFYRLCKSVDLIINPAVPQDLNGVVPESWQKPWLDSKSAVKYTLAGAASIPIISTPMRAYKEAIRDGETGILANSVDEFLEKIKFFETNPEEARKIGMAARKDIEANFDIKKRYPLYRDCILGNISQVKSSSSKKSYIVGVNSNEQPVASIIVLSYNQDKYLAEAIESAINQDFDRPFEVIVVDDGSTDNSINIANKFNNIKVIALPKNTDSWATEPLNIAVKEARGMYIGHVASDDILHESYLSKTVPIFESDPAIGIVSIGMHEMADGHISSYTYPLLIDPEKMRQIILERNFIFGSSPHTKQAWEVVGGYHPYYWQDWDLWIRIIWAGFKVAVCNNILYTYRVHDKSLSQSSREGIISEKVGKAILNMSLSHAPKLRQLNITKGELYAALEAQKHNQ